MSAVLNDERTNIARPRSCSHRDAINRSHDPAPNRRRLTETVTDEEERAFVAKSVLTLAILGVTPLILFLVIYYCCPDLVHFLDYPAQ